MLKLFEYNTTDFGFGQKAILADAGNVTLTREINSASSLSFSLPYDSPNIALIKDGDIISHEGEGFRIYNIRKKSMGMCEVSARDLFWSDSGKIHIPSVKDHIGISPSALFSELLENTSFSLFTDSELSALGLKRVDHDRFLIDFFSVDKTSPLDAAQLIINLCGKGEIFSYNFKTAIVEKVGKDNGAKLSLGFNLDNILVESDSSNVITRLYPYGADDLTVYSVNGKSYIDSEITSHGILEGFMNFDEISDPSQLYNRALWEFDPENPDRIDIPDITISGDFCDLSKLGLSEKVSIGDTVTVHEGKNTYLLRVVSSTEYPYEGKSGSIVLGRIKRDLFFYLSQMGKLSGKYKKVSNSSGNIKTDSLSGTLNTEVNNIKSGTGAMTVKDDLMTVRDKNNRLRIRLGNMGKQFVFELYNSLGNETISLDDSGDAEFSGKMSANSVFSGTLKTDKDAEIGQFLTIKTLSGGTESGGIKFVAPDGTPAGGIYQIESNNKVKLWIMSSDVILGGVSINDLAARVEALEGGKA